MKFDALWDNIFRDRKKGREGLLDFLRTIPIFTELTDKELQVLLPKVYIRHYTDGEPIFKEGDPSLGMYLIRSGTVTIIHQTADGLANVLATLQAGDFFGELGLVDDAPRSASAIAFRATEVIGLFKPELIEIVKRQPELGLKIFLAVAKVISSRLRRTNEELRKVLAQQQAERNV